MKTIAINSHTAKNKQTKSAFLTTNKIYYSLKIKINGLHLTQELSVNSASLRIFFIS